MFAHHKEKKLKVALHLKLTQVSKNEHRKMQLAGLPEEV